ncbi:hypothetical protein KUTeg_000394 [Tegillarca granosa]|uniref:BTB domain-containing protein n=1 Tax=Tegillarca granosa TaxID=220873 RepID=A0ABQ9FXE7_TEGGR|nr:hypothetical protein KUTeg_000394 [Tegillarca granosa]
MEIKPVKMIDSRTFKVHCQPHSAFKVMHDLRLRNLLCDVTLTVDGKDFEAHKIVLCGCSPYLRAMFTIGMLESDQDKVEIQGLEAWAMERLIDFMYTSTIEISVDNVQGLLQGASLLGLQQLRKICATFLQSQLTASNCLGGEDRSCSYNVTEKFDLLTETWSFAPNMKRKRAGAGSCVCDSKIYIAGGYDKTLHMDRASVECYDPTTEEWTFVSEMEKARSGLFNTMTNQWTTISSMNTPRAWPGVAVFDGRVYVIGGFDGSSRLRSVEVYDFDSDRWTFISNMIVSRAGCGAAVV